MSKSALELARTYKNAYEEAQNFQACYFAYNTALAYSHAGKKDQSLKYIKIALELPVEDAQTKIYAENLRLQLEGSSSKVFRHQLGNRKIFWR